MTNSQVYKFIITLENNRDMFQANVHSTDCYHEKNYFLGKATATDQAITELKNLLK